MPTRPVACLILAGGQGTRLNVLSKRRAKPGVPFGGTYRIIDFVLSNCMHSGVDRVGILTQYRPGSLLEHIGSGASWDFVGRRRTLDVLPPYRGRKGSDWYRATADAVYQNLAWLKNADAELTLILSGDHIYSMDYRKMLEFHRSKKADVTLAVRRERREELSQFGVVLIHGDGQIFGFQEKPKEPRSDLVNLGIYVFTTDVLIDGLVRDRDVPGSEHDFGKNVIPSLVDRARVMAYPFDGYWKDVGTVAAFWEANMDLLRQLPELDLRRWQVATNWELEIGTRTPARIRTGAETLAVVVSPGAVIGGKVCRSVLSPGVLVEPGAVVEDSVLMHDTRVCHGATVRRAVIDKDVEIGVGATVGGNAADAPANRDYPTHLSNGITLVGKSAKIPAGCQVGQNCLIADGVQVQLQHVPSGRSVLE
jgi:glucose-1-phosphate adenylyltransferase